LTLENGEKVSWMNVADEGTTAHFKAGVHSCQRVAEIPLQDAIQTVNSCFKRWGLPKEIKIDNGYPFVHPNYMDMPTRAKLWWIGLGIKVTQNRPRCPQENGVVECLQGIMNSWSNPKGCTSIEEFQKRLDEESDFQRNHYRIPAKKNKTRIECYPELETNPRRYDPQKFDMKLVDQYLSKQVWTRRLCKNGELSFYGKRNYIGIQHARQVITITFDPIERQWRFCKTDGTFLKPSSKAVPDKKDLINFATMSKN